VAVRVVSVPLVVDLQTEMPVPPVIQAQAAIKIIADSVSPKVAATSAKAVSMTVSQVPAMKFPHLVVILDPVTTVAHPAEILVHLVAISEHANQRLANLLLPNPAMAAKFSCHVTRKNGLPKQTVEHISGK